MSETALHFSPERFADDRLDNGQRRALFQEEQHGIDILPAAGEDRFHRTVAAVANPAVEAEIARFLACPCPVPHALYATGDRHAHPSFVTRTDGHEEAYSRRVESTETESPTATST